MTTVEVQALLLIGDLMVLWTNQVLEGRLKPNVLIGSIVYGPDTGKTGIVTDGIPDACVPTFLRAVADFYEQQMATQAQQANGGETCLSGVIVR